MPAFVALLRGVNVGKANRVPMAGLRRLLADLGYTGIATLLNSGNAVFHASGGSAAKHAGRIAAAISGKMHLDVPVIVKSANELTSIVSDNPIAPVASDHSRLLVAFVQDSRALSSLKSIETCVVPPERFAIGRNAAYLYIPSGILKSKAGEALLGKVGQAATTRNWKTVLKLQAFAGRVSA